MRIAIMGAGALGCYFGGRLAAAGHKVVFIARGAQLMALTTQGLRIESGKGNLTLKTVEATDDPAKAGVADVILFLVKNYHVEEAARQMLPMVGPHTMIITGQNGVSAPERVEAITGKGSVVPGVVRMPASLPEPGVVLHNADFDHFSFGETDLTQSARVTAFCNALVEAGTMGKISDNILHELWFKFIMQASFASITALTRLNNGPLRNNPASAQLFKDSMAEAQRVAEAEVPGFPKGNDVKLWDFLGQLPPGTHASMLDDLLRGKPIEIDALSGDVVRRGRAHGIPTPIHAVFEAALRPFEFGATT